MNLYLNCVVAYLRELSALQNTQICATYFQWSTSPLDNLMRLSIYKLAQLQWSA